LFQAAGYQRNSFAFWSHSLIDFALADNEASRTCTWITRRHIYAASFVRAATLAIHGMTFFAYLEHGAAGVTATLAESKGCFPTIFAKCAKRMGHGAGRNCRLRQAAVSEFKRMDTGEERQNEDKR
jgi:hypothetical protein